MKVEVGKNMTKSTPLKKELPGGFKFELLSVENKEAKSFCIIEERNSEAVVDIKPRNKS